MHRGDGMRTLLGLLAAAVCVTACAAVQQDRQQARMAELRRQVEAEKQDCDNLYPRNVAGPQKYSYRARCLNEVETRLVRPFDPFPDLLDQRLAVRGRCGREDIAPGQPRFCQYPLRRQSCGIPLALLVGA